jgi:hypothetical protein
MAAEEQSVRSGREVETQTLSQPPLHIATISSFYFYTSFDKLNRLDLYRDN